MISGRHTLAKKGVTLVEIVLVAAIMGVIMAALVPYIRTVNQVWQYGHTKSEVLQNGRVGLSRMTRVIRDTRFITEIDTTERFDEGRGDYIRLQDANNNPIVFFHNVTDSPFFIAGAPPNVMPVHENDLAMQMIIPATGAIETRPLASSVNSLVFTYLDWRMDPAHPAASPAEVRGVSIDMELYDTGQVLAEPHTLNSVAALRMARNSAPGTWVTGDGFVKKLNANGDELFNVQGTYDSPVSPSIDPSDGSAWITDANQGILVKLGADGSEVFRKTGLDCPTLAAVNPNNGFCWVVTKGNGRIAYYTTGGVRKFDVPADISSIADIKVSTGDGHLWVASCDRAEPGLVKLRDSNGSQAFPKITANIGRPFKLAVDPVDSTCWLLDKDNGKVIKFESDGERAEIPGTMPPRPIEITGLNSPTGITVDPSDSSLWIGNRDELLRYSADGQTLIQQVGDLDMGINWPCYLSIDQGDGVNGAIWFVNGITYDPTDPNPSHSGSVIKVDIFEGRKDVDLDHTDSGRYLWVIVDPRAR